MDYSRRDWERAGAIARADTAGNATTTDAATPGDVVAELVRRHREGWMPLSHFHDAYSKRQWKDGVEWLRCYPPYVDLLARAAEFDQRMHAQLGKRYAAAVSQSDGVGPAHNRARILPVSWTHVFDLEHGTLPRTPASLAAVYVEFERSIQHRHEWHRVMADLSLYDPSVDPDSKLAAMRDTQAQWEFARLVKIVHGVDWLGRLGRRKPEDLLSGRTTVRKEIEEERARVAANEARTRAFDEAVFAGIGAALDVFESMESRHVQALNRVLMQRSRGTLRIIRAYGTGEDWSLEVMDRRCVYSRGQTADVRALYLYLDLAYTALERRKRAGEHLRLIEIEWELDGQFRTLLDEVSGAETVRAATTAEEPAAA